MPSCTNGRPDAPVGPCLLGIDEHACCSDAPLGVANHRAPSLDVSLAALHRRLDSAAESIGSQLLQVQLKLALLFETMQRNHAEMLRHRAKDRAEITSLIRLLFSQLDQRLTSLEGTVANLAERVERLEAHDTQA